MILQSLNLMKIMKMKPRNDFERTVEKVRNALNPLNSEDIEFIDTMFDEMDDDAISALQDEKCYNRSFNIYEYSRRIKMQSYFTKIETFKGMQVVRTFSLELRKRGINSFPQTRHKEVLQKWYGDGGQSAIVACKFLSFNYGYDDWAFGSDLSLRSPHSGNNYQERTLYRQVAEKNNIRVSTFAPFLKKYGLSSKTPMINQTNKALAIELAQTHLGEYLLKNNGHNLFCLIANGSIQYSKLEEYLPSLKICFRHGYTITDYSLWIDLLNFLVQMNKDIHSPKYIMPDNLMVAHDYWLKKVQEVERKKRYKEKMEEAREHEKDFYNKKKQYFGLSFFTSSGLIVRSVESVAEMIDEGDKMHHCVGCYWNHDNSLIMVCRSPHGDRIATIEVNISNLTVSQIRGLQNKKPNEFDEIMDSLTKNMRLIRDRRDNPANYNPDNAYCILAAS